MAFSKQQGSSRAFMVEDDAPKRRKFTRKTTNNSGRDAGHTGDVGLLYDDSLYLQDEIGKTLESIIKSLEEKSIAPSEIHDAYHAINNFLGKEEKFPRVGCMAGYHDHPGTKGCHPIDKPHRGSIITAMGGSGAYERVHPNKTPEGYGS